MLYCWPVHRFRQHTSVKVFLTKSDHHTIMFPVLEYVSVGDRGTGSTVLNSTEGQMRMVLQTGEALFYCVSNLW